MWGTEGFFGVELRRVLVLNWGVFGVELRSVLNWGILSAEKVWSLCSTDVLNWGGGLCWTNNLTVLRKFFILKFSQVKSMEGVTSFYVIFHIEANFVLRRITDGIPASTWSEIFGNLSPKILNEFFTSRGTKINVRYHFR